MKSTPGVIVSYWGEKDPQNEIENFRDTQNRREILQNLQGLTPRPPFPQTHKQNEVCTIVKNVLEKLVTLMHHIAGRQSAKSKGLLLVHKKFIYR